MAAKLSEELGEQVTCPICLEHYSDPRLLPCLHTYCRQCLQDLLAKGERMNAVVCPECREDVQIISGDVTKLRVNFWINNLLSLLAIHSTDEKDGGKTELTCENCDIKEKATRRCANCSMFLCDFCSTAHQRSLATKDHQLMTLDEIKSTGIPVIEKQLFCGKHKGEVKKLFCNTCQELICRDCTIIDHRDHQFSFVEDVADQHKQLFKTEVERASNIKKKIEAVLKSVQKMTENVEETSKATEKDVDDFIDKQIKALEEKRIVLKQETKKIAATKMKELAAQEDVLTMHLTGLKSAIEFTEKMLTNGGNSDVLSISKQLTSRLSQLSKKPFPKHPCQENKIGLKFDKNLIRDFIHGANVFDTPTVDYDMCSVAQQINGHLVEDQGYIHAIQGQLLKFVVQIKNSLGKKLKSMADRMEAKLSYLNAGIELALPIISLIDGTYSFEVMYELRSKIHVMVDGKNILGSPINIHKQAQRNNRPVNSRLGSSLNSFMQAPRNNGPATGLIDYDIYEEPYDPKEECCPQDACYSAQAGLHDFGGYYH